MSLSTGVADVVRRVDLRAVRIYDGTAEVHKGSLAKQVKRDWREPQR